MKINKIVVGPLQTNCYLISFGDRALVIDPGDQVERIIERLGQLKLEKIILTHYHFDHVNAALELKEKTGADILIHEGEKSFLGFKADQYLKEGNLIQFGQESLKVIHSPGHTQGSICLLGQKEIFVGDLIFAEGYGRTDLPGGSDQAMSQSLEKISQIIKSGMTVYSGHGEVFKSNTKN